MYLFEVKEYISKSFVKIRPSLLNKTLFVWLWYLYYSISECSGLLKCTGYESASTPVHFSDSILCNTKLAAMFKCFGLKSSNFLGGYYQWLSFRSNNDIKIASSMSMRVSNAKRPHTQIWTQTAIFTNTDGPIFLKLLQTVSLTTKKKKDSTKINTVWCKTKYIDQIVIFRTPHKPPCRI